MLAAMSFPTWLPFMLGLLAAVGPLATDMYLPAFGAIEAEFASGPGTAQYTLSAWFAGLAVGQMTQGTLSDRYGRRWPLFFGTLLFSAACAGCALAPDITTLSVLRMVSAFGGAAGMVIPRAVVRDIAEGHAAARIMSKLMLVMGAAPILAPSLGGLLLGVGGGWRGIFWVCAGYGAFCAFLVWRYLPDTLPVAARVKLGPGAQVARYVAILGERGFITHALMGGFAMFGMFAYLAGSPQVFVQQFGLPPSFYAGLFGVCAAGFILASQINPRLLPRYGAERVARVAVRVFLAATAAMTVAAFTGWGGWPVVAACAFFSMSSQGFVMPNAVVGALHRHAGHAGSASALMGTMQFALGALSAATVGMLSDGSARPMGVLMLIGALGSTAAEWCRPRRQ